MTRAFLRLGSCVLEARHAVLASLLTLLAAACAPTPIVVDSTDDDFDQGANGNCTLREAVLAANGNAAVDACRAGGPSDTIVVPAGTYGLAIPGRDEDAGETGDLDLLEPMTIRGDGADATIVEGASLDRVFHVLVSGTGVTLDGLAVSGGWPGTEGGGGIRNDGVLNLESVVVAGNRVGPAETGDAPASSIIIPLDAFGGGIYNAGTLSARASRIEGNLASAGSEPFSGAGGGIYSAGDMTLHLCTVAGNQASGAPASGGGIVISGNATLRAVDVIGNAAFGSGLASRADGGGIDLNGTAAIDLSTVEGNLARGGDGGGGSAGGDASGGAIRNNGQLALLRSALVGNQAAGGLYGGRGQGGAVASNGTLAIQNATVTGNLARGGDGLVGAAGGAGEGGAIYGIGIATLGHVTFDGNLALGGAGGIGTPAAQGGYGAGGTVYMDTASVAIFASTIVTGSLAFGGEGGIDPEGGPGGEWGAQFGFGCFGLPPGISAGGNIETVTDFPDLDEPADECPFTDPTDQMEVSREALALEPLASNGGRTATHALGVGSVAVNAGAAATCPDDDQRGYLRTDGACDTGSYELGAATCTDADSDGYAIEGGDCGPVDCDDGESRVHPGGLDIPGNGLDDDCNPATPPAGCPAEVGREGGANVDAAGAVAVALGAVALLRARRRPVCEGRSEPNPGR